MQHTVTASTPRTTHGKKLTPVCLALSALLLHGTAALADTASYPGDSLQTIDLVPNSLGTPLNGSNSNSTSGNIVTVSDLGSTAPIGGNVYGAFYGGAVDVTNNTVNIIDGRVNGAVLGGRSSIGNANFNTVNMTGGTVGGQIFGGRGFSATDNAVVISGGTVSGPVGGAFAESGDATNNSLTINGGTINNFNIFGGSAIGNANNNTVTISNGTIASVDILGGTSSSGNANNNTVSISGGTLNRAALIAVGDSASGSAINNTLTISGNPTFNTDANPFAGTGLYGGFGSTPSTDLRSGNTLNLRTTNITVNRIANFANIYFYLPTTAVAGDTVLTLTNAGGTDLFGNTVVRGADITNTTIGVGIAGGTSPLQTGDSITLIRTSGGDLLTDANTLVNNVSGMQGISLLYDFTLSQPDSSTLLATATKIVVNPQTKSLSEGSVAGPTFINQGGDLTASAGMANALGAAQASTSVFGAFSGGNSRYKTGSHVDVKGVNFLTGASAGLSNSMGPLMLGGFFEAGNGNYDSYNSFVNAPSVYAHGDLRYYGAGVLAQQQLANNFYVEGSVRLGRVEHDYSSVIADNAVYYDLHNTYTGAHLGAGRVIPLSNAHLDVYGKYFWSRQASAERTILGDVYSFDAINSHRTKLGASYTHQIKEGLQLKGGLAWEHEFDGKARASVHNLPIATPELKGSSAVAELGLKVVPQKNLSFEAGIQGYAGTRQGVTGSLAVKYKF